MRRRYCLRYRVRAALKLALDPIFKIVGHTIGKFGTTTEKFHHNFRSRCICPCNFSLFDMNGRDTASLLAAVLVSGTSDSNVQSSDHRHAPRRDASSFAADDSCLGGAQPCETGFHPPAATYEKKSAFAESWTLLRLLFSSAHRIRVALLVIGIATFLVVNMFGQIRLNEWNGSFFDALAQRNLPSLGHQLLIFFGIVALLLAVVVGQTWMQQMLKVRLRQWLTHHLLDQWLAPGRAYRLGLAGPIGVNPDQRIEEDTRKLTDLSAGLGVGLLQAGLLLVSFISILWTLSNGLVLTVVGYEFTIPGYMVWCAIRSE